MNEITMRLQIDDYIKSALKEDISNEDISTNAVMPDFVAGSVELIAKEEGIIAGLDIFERTFKLLDEQTTVERFVKDGDKVTPGLKLALVKGDIRVLLSGERTALNYLQRMSGIASLANKMVKMLEGTGITLLDTRKTTPNNRIFEKIAVKIGGASNHRYNLSDAVMLKDNHIAAAGGVKEAVKMAREYTSFVHKIEVECENLDMVRDAIEAGADIIMLDNMDHDTMAEAVKIIGGRALTEISGNVTAEKIESIKDIVCWWVYGMFMIFFFYILIQTLVVWLLKFWSQRLQPII